MKNNNNFKKKIAVLFSAIIILVLLLIKISIPDIPALKAGNLDSKLVDITTNSDDTEHDESNKSSIDLKFFSEKTQILQFSDIEKYEVHELTDDNNQVVAEKISNTQFEMYKQSLKSEKESDKLKESLDIENKEKKSKIFYVSENKEKELFILLYEKSPIKLKISRGENTDFSVFLKTLDNKERQEVFSFKKESNNNSKSNDSTDPSFLEESSFKEDSSEKETRKNFTEISSEISEDIPTDNSSTTSDSAEKKEQEQKSNTNNALTGTEFLKKIGNKKIVEKDSFKPIELPDETPVESKITNRSLSTKASITGAKMTVKTGTKDFDSDNSAGHDSSVDNNIVRSFDSIIYLLTFSLESNKLKNYTDITYRVDLELANAVGPDSAGKERFNAETVDYFNGQLVDEANGTKTSKGSVESTISSNGQVLVPVFVNVYGAENGKIIKPKIKLTVVSAKNSETKEVEQINETYDDTVFSDLKVPDTKVSAQPSVEAKIVLGNRQKLPEYISGYKNDNWEAISTGLTLGLKPISGRSTDDFKGSTFPTGSINVRLQTASTFTTDGGVPKNIPVHETNNIASGYTRRTNALDSSISKQETTGWDRISGPSGIHNINSDLIKINVPNGKTQQVHISEPQVSLDEKKKIGVYDTGNFKVVNNYNNNVRPITITVSDYSPIYNPYTYTYGGIRTNSNEKLFASGMIISEWCKEYLSTQSKGTFATEFSVYDIEYSGKTEKGDSKFNVSASTASPGSLFVGSTLPDDSTGVGHYGNGDSKVATGQKIHMHSALVISDKTVNTAEMISRWNANSFEYDKSRPILNQVTDVLEEKTLYGVGKTKNNPTLNDTSKNAILAEYNWYDNPEKAEQNGKISAVRQFYVNTDQGEGPSWGNISQIPAIVIGGPGATDKLGNPHVLRTNVYTYKPNGEAGPSGPEAGGNYVPSKFDSNGQKISGHNTASSETAFIKSFSIQTTTEVEKPIYKTSEIMKWKVTGNLLSETNTNYGVKLAVEIPKGLSYDKNSAKDSLGNKLPDPTATVTSTGTKLVWQLNNLNPTKGDFAEVNFTTTTILKDLTFNDQKVASVKVKTVGEIWEMSTGTKDTTPEGTRSSSDDAQVYLIQQILLTKSVNTKEIEAGSADETGSTWSTDVTYTIKLKNNSTDTLTNVKVLDVLPKDQDANGSLFSGSYIVKNVIVTDGITINFSNSSIPETTDPNAVSGWANYVPGSSNETLIKDTKALLFSAKELKVDEEITLKFTISPNGQKAGDIYRNRAVFNSDIKLPVNSNIVETKVYGRDVSGKVWYDDDYDGLIGNKKDGSPENFAEGIKIRLKRYANYAGTYEWRTLDQSLTGEKFVDGSGSSSIKTDSQGYYCFSNLPVGRYIVEFEVGDFVTQKLFVVTKKNVGSDLKINSKADPEKFTTSDFQMPELSDLIEKADPIDQIYHKQYLNCGLTPLSKIRVFKYEEGTVIDSDDDGKLIDAEIEASTTHALEGAEFDLYEGDSVSTSNKLGSGKTDKNGWLQFDGLTPGDYTLVETEAPAGFELLKDPIKVTVPTYNSITKVHVSDKGQTKLPFTGGTKAMRIMLIVAACLLVVGMFGVFLHFRPVKVRGGN